MPVKASDIPKFENDNNISINVYSYNDDGLSFCYLPKMKEITNKIYLLLPKDEGTFHHCLIVNFQSFIRRVCRSKMETGRVPKTKFCSNYKQFVLRHL